MKKTFLKLMSKKNLERQIKEQKIKLGLPAYSDKEAIKLYIEKLEKELEIRNKG